MTKLWTKKNPFLSMWMTEANAAAGKARAPMMAAARREQAAMVKQATRPWLSAWGFTAKNARRKAR